MQQVLVHIDQGLGPIGAWTFCEGALRHFYPDSLDPYIPARARDLMARRDNDVPVGEWMDLIADCDPTLLDEFKTFEVDDDLLLPIILSEFRRSWTTASD